MLCSHISFVNLISFNEDTYVEFVAFVLEKERPRDNERKSACNVAGN